MRLLCLLYCLLQVRADAQPVLYAAASFTKEYVVGAKLPASGLFQWRDNQWRHIGFAHPFVFGFAADPADPATLYLAAGNGLIRTRVPGRPWTVLTGSDVTELRDVVAGPGAIYYSYVAGIRVTQDGGKTFQELGGGLPRKFTETIRLDRTHPEVLLAGTEQGVYRSSNGGQTWTLAGASGLQVTRIEQSPHEAGFWLAATQQGGLFASRDGGVTFENSGRLGVDRNLYDIAFDPGNPQRIAIAGWGTGVALSHDGGKTWQSRNIGLPRPDVTSVVFDPIVPGRLFAAVHEEAVYVSTDSGATWRKLGLDGASVSRLRFVGLTERP